MGLPGGFEREIFERELQQSGALAESQVLGGNPVDVVNQIERLQAAVLKCQRARQDVFHEQDAVNTVTSAIQ